ncbi:MAG: HIT family protein [Lachnospiraceae bacterium]|nr:HIT family protein [Lachnospiraceae bacterium]
MNCYYCNDREKLNSLMIPICELRTSKAYLFRDQKYRGKCIVVFNEHKTELFQLTPTQQCDFIQDVADVADAINKLFYPNKINYAIYGDVVSHLHVHVTPKYIDGPQWGMPFRDDPKPLLLSEEEYNRAVSKIKELICVKK